MHSLYYLGLVLFTGIVMGKIISYAKLPKVTGYLIGGVIIGPSLLGIIPAENAAKLNIISEAALGFIAYSIGSSLNIKNLKKIGKGIAIITLFESLMAVVLVNFAMICIFNEPIAFSLLISAIAAATAPAATIMVIRQYKAKGPLVDTLLPVVAIDDAVAVIVFGISMTISKVLMDSSATLNVYTVILPFIEIIVALILGLVVGSVLCVLGRNLKSDDQFMNITIALIFLTIGLAIHFKVSSLLACMALGATISNLSTNNTKLLSVVDRFTPPVFIVFFTLSGIELNIYALKTIGFVGIGYVIFRVLGKILGAYVGSRLAGCSKVVQRYLGLTLIPQAGVAIGLAMVVQNEVPQYGKKISTIILAATVIYELIGPLITKIAIQKASKFEKNKEINNSQRLSS
ncbi:MAG: cation:proton antiporter [Clostridium sp.]